MESRKETEPIEIELSKDIQIKDALKVSGREAYEYFKKKHKVKKSKVNEFKYYQMAVHTIFKVIRDLMLDKESGVYVKELGYFAVVMYPKKRSFSFFDRKGEFAFQAMGSASRSYMYYPYFFGDVSPRGGFERWTFDRTFSRDRVLYEVRKRVRKGQRYILSYTVIKGLVEACKKQAKFNFEE